MSSVLQGWDPRCRSKALAVEQKALPAGPTFLPDYLLTPKGGAAVTFQPQTEA